MNMAVKEILNACDGPEKGRLFVRETEERHLSLLLGFLGEKDRLDVGQNTTLGDGYSGEQLVQLLVVTDCQLKMTWDDTRLLVVTSSVASQFKDFSSQVLHDSGKINGGTSTNTFSIVSLAEQTMDTSHRELEPSTA